MINFFIAAFGILITIFGSVQTPQVKESTTLDDIRFHKASIILNNQNSSLVTRLWAYSILRDYDNAYKTYDILKSNYTFCNQGNKLNCSSSEYLYANLIMASMVYNSNFTAMNDFLKHVKYPNNFSTINEQSYYLHKLYDIENGRNTFEDSYKRFKNLEDFSCNEIKFSALNSTGKANIDKCTFSELNTINNIERKLAEQGNLSDYYNLDNKIFSINSFIYNIVDFFHYFIITALFSGPIILIAGIRYFNSR